MSLVALLLSSYNCDAVFPISLRIIIVNRFYLDWALGTAERSSEIPVMSFNFGKVGERAARTNDNLSGFPRFMIRPRLEVKHHDPVR